MFGPKDGVGQIEEDTQELTNTLETATHKDTKKICSYLRINFIKIQTCDTG